MTPTNWTGSRTFTLITRSRSAPGTAVDDNSTGLSPKPKGASCTHYQTSMKSWPLPRSLGSTSVPTRPSSTGNTCWNRWGSSTPSCRPGWRNRNLRWSRLPASPGIGRAQKKTRSTPGCGMCRIDGAAEGLLAGKSVSYKDHIAVAGIPMSLGSFALEAVAHGRRAEPPQLPRPCVRQGPECASHLHQGLRHRT